MKKNTLTTILIGVILVLSGSVVYSGNKTKSLIAGESSMAGNGQLEYSLIKEMVSTYKSRQANAINNTLNLNDARSVWFDLQSLEDFICQIRDKAEGNGTNINKLGVRFYYAAYPDTSSWSNYQDLSGIDKEYEHRHTIVMIPTINRNAVNEDFNPLDIDTYTKSLKTCYEGNSIPIPALKTSAYNHGSLIPPGGIVGVAFD